jgi:hypothetical protein
VAGRPHPASSERLRPVDGTPVPCGASRTTARRSDLFGYAGYGRDTSHHRFYWGANLLLVVTCEGTTTGFGLANPKLAGERHALLGLLEVPANRPVPGTVLVSDKGLAGRQVESALADQQLTLLRPARSDEPDPGGFPAWLRQRVEAIIWTLKHQLSLDRHGGRSPRGCGPASSSACSP